MSGLNFEKALADLEGIVEKLEKGELSLNESLSLFEQGVKLARFLREELAKAEKKVEILLKDEKGEIRAEPFDLDREVGFTEEAEAEPAEDEEEENEGEDEEPPF